jgi:hypothetical protein
MTKKPHYRIVVAGGFTYNGNGKYYPERYEGTLYDWHTSDIGPALLTGLIIEIEPPAGSEPAKEDITDGKT